MRKEKLDKIGARKTIGIIRVLQNKWIMVGICALASLIFFFGLNYFFNTILLLPDFFMGRQEHIVGIRNAVYLNPRGGPFYLLLFFFLVVQWMLFFYRVKVALRDLNEGQKGTERWTTPKELEEQYRSVPERREFYLGMPGVPIARCGDRIYIDSDPVHNLIIGTTRSGKGEVFVVPTIDILSRAEQQPSMVVTDLKLELYAASRRTLEQRGYKVLLFNLIDPLQSIGYNPLQPITEAYKHGDYAAAELLCHTFAFAVVDPLSDGQNKFWGDTAVSLVEAMILALIEDCLEDDRRLNERRRKSWERKKRGFSDCSIELQQEIRAAARILDMRDEGQTKDQVRAVMGELTDQYWEENRQEYVLPEDTFQPIYPHEKQITLYSVYNNMVELQGNGSDEGEEDKLDLYFSSRPQYDRAKAKYAAIAGGSTRSRASAKMTFSTKMAIFSLEPIAAMTARSDIDLEEIGFGEQPVALFIGLPDYDKSNHYLASVFIQQIYHTLSRRAEMEGRCDRLVHFILDEFGNLPPIPTIGSMASMGLSRGFRMSIVLQSYGQLEKYEKEERRAILDNCNNVIYMLAGDNETAEKFAASLGGKTITGVSRNGEHLGLDKHYTETLEERLLLNKNELMRLVPGETVVSRVIHRTDLQGNPVRPYPIFNTGVGGRMKYRHKYLQKEFPSDLKPKDVIDQKLNVDLVEYRYDIQAHMEQLQQVRRDGFSSGHKKEELASYAAKILQGAGMGMEIVTVDDAIQWVYQSELAEEVKRGLLQVIGAAE